MNCYKETPLSDIDTVPGPSGNTTSIFSAGVQGTLTGMSRLRSVAGPNLDGYDGRTILAVLSENWAAGVCGGLPPIGTDRGERVQCPGLTSRCALLMPTAKRST